MKNVMYIFIIIFVFILGYVIGRLTIDMHPSITILDKSLKIQSDTKEVGLIPKGTVMYYVKGMSEGYDIYKIYISKEGKPFKLTKAKKKWLIAPVWVINEYEE
jgi:hypothetical protein